MYQCVRFIQFSMILEEKGIILCSKTEFSDSLGGYSIEDSKNGGDPLEDFTNRSYKGKTVTVNNEDDLDMVLAAKKAMGDKPVIVCVKMTSPLVMCEFESNIDAIVASFGDQQKAVLEILCGIYEPSGLLPLQIPANMKVVEEQFEDIPFNTECHVDTEGNTYNFAFGMNWSGVIEDERVAKYSLKK